MQYRSITLYSTAGCWRITWNSWLSDWRLLLLSRAAQQHTCRVLGCNNAHSLLLLLQQLLMGP
jgi:hypothetical protein